MKSITSIARCVLVTASLVLLTGPLHADSHNQLRDPGFELRTPPDDGGWRMFQVSEVTAEQARSGKLSMYHGGFSRKVAFPPYVIGNDSGAFQEFPAEPGSRWQLTGYAMTTEKLLGSPAFGLVQISFFDDRGNDLGTVETTDTPVKAKLSAEINSQSPVNEWIFLDTGIATAPEGTAIVRAFTLFVNHSGNGKRQGVYFDDLVLQKHLSD